VVVIIAKTSLSSRLSGVRAEAVHKYAIRNPAFMLLLDFLHSELQPRFIHQLSVGKAPTLDRPFTIVLPFLKIAFAGAEKPPAQGVADAQDKTWAACSVRREIRVDLFFHGSCVCRRLTSRCHRDHRTASKPDVLAVGPDDQLKHKARINSAWSSP
jgi:hypothetical protein